MDALTFVFSVLLLGSLSAAAMLIGFQSATRRQPDAARTLSLKRHLADIDARYRAGLIDDDEHGATRAETVRRLLSDAQASPRADGPIPRWLWALALATPVLAAGAYVVVSAPGLGDLPYKSRLETWRATDPSALAPEEIAAVITDLARQHPKDPDPLKHLARVRAASNDPIGAVQALRKAVALAPNRADLWTDLGEASVALAKGEIDRDARWAFAEGLKHDPANPSARYHLARAQLADGHVEHGLKAWRKLAADLPRNDPRREALEAEIRLVAARGGLPPASGASDDTRQAGAIATMVAGLAARLEATPDDPDGWVRLVRAYGVVGDLPHRDGALARANALYRDQPKVLAALRQAADAHPSNGPGSSAPAGAQP